MTSLSICITTYNNSATIENVLKSSINQIVGFNEIIIIDDNSQDSTVLLAKTFLQKENINFKFFCFDKNNGGPAWSRNKGIDLSQSDYICFLDGDDMNLSNRCLVIKNFLKNMKPDLLIHGGFSASIENDKPTKIGLLNTLDINNISLKMLLKTDKLTPGSSIVLKIKDKKKYRFTENQSLIAGEDRDLIYKIAEDKGEILTIKEKLFIYNSEDIYNQNSKKIKHITSPKKTIKIVNYFFKNYCSRYKYFFSNLELSLIVALIRNKNYEKAFLLVFNLEITNKFRLFFNLLNKVYKKQIKVKIVNILNRRNYRQYIKKYYLERFKKQI